MTVYVRPRALRRSSATVVLTSIVTTLLHAFVLALPVMWLSAFLHGEGWAVTPLGYWASYLTALLLEWIIDGSGTVRRALDQDR